MKTAIKVLVIIGTTIGWLFWLMELSLANNVTSPMNMYIMQMIVGFIAMSFATVFGFIIARKKIRNILTLILSILLLLTNIALLISGSPALLVFIPAAIIGIIQGCQKERLRTNDATI